MDFEWDRRDVIGILGLAGADASATYRKSGA
jgi:hypothetical protein